jgi:hypothetical protein
MDEEGEKPKLTHIEQSALKGLTMPTGPLEGNLPIRKYPDRVASATRYLDIPATSQIPTRPISNKEKRNIVKTVLYKKPELEGISFNPVLEYEIYEKLSGMGFVTMEPMQGTNKVKVDITEEGAKMLGKELVIETKAPEIKSLT